MVTLAIREFSWKVQVVGWTNIHNVFCAYQTVGIMPGKWYISLFCELMTWISVTFFFFFFTPGLNWAYCKHMRGKLRGKFQLHLFHEKSKFLTGKIVNSFSLRRNFKFYPLFKFKRILKGNKQKSLFLIVLMLMRLEVLLSPITSCLWGGCAAD